VHGQIVAARVEPVQRGKHFALVFNLDRLPHNRSAGDVLHRALHQTVVPTEFGLHAQNFASVSFADLLAQLPVKFTSKKHTCHYAIINELETWEM